MVTCPFSGSELDGVAEDVAHDLRDPQRIRANRDAVGRQRFDLDVAALGQRLEHVLRLTEDRGDGHILQIECELTSVETHGIQKVPDEAVHLPAGSQRDFEELGAAHGRQSLR